MIAIAVKMLWHNKVRSLSTLVGVAIAFFLCAAQIGLLVGWCNTTTAIIRHADADVWVMTEQTPAFDYGVAIPRQRLYQVRSVPGVEWAEAMYMGWVFWHRADGRNTNIELVGLDEDLVGGPWEMAESDVKAVLQPNAVIVDELYREQLGVRGIGDEIEIAGRRAVVRGVSRSVRTFTAAPFVFCSLDAGVKYDKTYRADEITFVLARAAPGVTPEELRDRIEREVPSVEALTAYEFTAKTIAYWMLETGVGITVVLTAILGLVVGTVIISQTLYAITHEHLANYATLMAIGFGRRQLMSVVVFQAVVIGLAGIAVGSAAFWYVTVISATTPIPIETTPAIFAGNVAALEICCVLAAFLSIRSIFSIDPVVVFRN